MSKTIKISEDRFNKALRKIVAEEFEGADNNYEPFKSQIEDHDEGIVGEPTDPTVYDKNQGIPGNV